MSKLDRRRKGVFGPAMGKQCIIFIDDLNLPQKDGAGSIPAVELLRQVNQFFLIICFIELYLNAKLHLQTNNNLHFLSQWIDHGYWYDKKDSSKLELLDCLLLTAMSPAESSGRSEVTPRFLRHMNILTMDQFDDVTLRRIFQTEIDWHFKVTQSLIFYILLLILLYEITFNQPYRTFSHFFGQDESFEAAIVSLAHPLVEATLHLYKDVLNAFLPTPATCHYMFNLRDFAKVVQGIKLVPATHLRDPNKVLLPF